MNYSKTLSKGTEAFVWIYKTIISKFTKPLYALKKRFPIIETNPYVRYSTLPILVAVFFLLRYVLKTIIIAFASWTSSFIGETSNFQVCVKSIVFSLIAVLVITKLFFWFRNNRKDTKI